MVCVFGVGQHAGNKAICRGKPLDGFEAVCLVDGEAHLFIACKNPVRMANNASPTMTPQNILK